MNNKFLLKAIVKYIFYFICMTVIVLWTYLCRLYILSFMILLFEILVLMGILDGLITRKKQRFLQEIDGLLSEELYRKITYPFYIQHGYCELEKTVYLGAVLALWIDDEGEKVGSVTIVKKDYIFDSDFSLIEQGLNVELFCNSYYKGNRMVCEIVNRKNIWKIYQALKQNNSTCAVEIFR